MGIPSYPEFRPIGLEDKKAIDEILVRSNPDICEYTFSNLYSWRSLYDLSVSLADGFILLRANKSGAKDYFEPIGLGGKGDIIKKIVREAGTSIIFVSGETKSLFEKSPEYSIIQDKDNSDYVYETKELIELRGKKFDGKRNFIKRFRQQNEYEYAVIGEQNLPECVEFVERWCEFRDCSKTESLAYEKTALLEMLKNYSYLGLSGGTIEIEGKICALALGEKLNKDTFVLHVLKSKAGITGLNQVMNQEFIAREASGYSFLNMEQDLGVEGLRKAKESYHPLKMINKFILKKV